MLELELVRLPLKLMKLVSTHSAHITRNIALTPFNCVPPSH